MPAFKTHRAYWNFAKSVKSKYRYVHSKEAMEFFNGLSVFVRKSEADLPSGTPLARAQLGHGTRPLEIETGEVVDEIPSAHPAKRIKPLSNRAKEGRVNPKGIAYLYLSDDINTAIAETRHGLDTTFLLAYSRQTMT